MINYFFNKLIELDRTAKQVIQVFTDIIIIIFCFYLAFTVRLLELSNLHDAYLTIIAEDSWKVLTVVIFITIITAGFLGVYRTVIRFAGERILILISVISIISELNVLCKKSLTLLSLFLSLAELSKCAISLNL